MKVPEERLNMIDPVCELFPKMAACHYYRYGMGGIEDDRHSICVLGLNMINDKVFIGKKHALSNKSFSQKFFWPNSIFLQFQKWPKINF